MHKKYSVIGVLWVEIIARHFVLHFFVWKRDAKGEREKPEKINSIFTQIENENKMNAEQYVMTIDKSIFLMFLL